MITINQYIKLLEEFLKQHKQINTVLTSNEADFAAYDEAVYPVAHIDYVTQRINGDNISHQFEIIIGDLFDPNIPGSEFEIYSDCNLIADDVVTYFENQLDEGYELDLNTSIQKFLGNVDRVAGAVFVLTFNQFREANKCILPIEDNLSDDLIKLYYGVVNDIPTNLDGLSSISITDNQGTVATLQTGLNRKFAIAVNEAYTLLKVIDLNASDLDVTALYEPHGSIIKNNTTYNLYYYEQAINFSMNHSHLISIK